MVVVKALNMTCYRVASLTRAKELRYDSGLMLSIFVSRVYGWNQYRFPQIGY